MSGHIGRIAGAAALLALAMALPATVGAQTFVDPRQAPVDQYGTPTPTPGPRVATPTPTPQPTATPDGPGRETSGPDRERDGRAGAGRGAGGDEGGTVRRERGGDLASSLPFTGFNLLTLLLIGLLLAAGGMALRAAQNRRARRT